MINQPSLVIIIDQWKWRDNRPGHPKIEASTELTQHIVEFLKFPQIHTAVLASYDCSEELYSDTVWYKNRSAEFGHDIRLECSNIRDYGSSLGYHQTTNDLLLNYVNTNIKQIAMRHMWELQSYLKTNPEIKNIYIVGGDWNLCVENRGIGYTNLIQKVCINNGPNLLTKLDCISTTDLDGKGATPILDSNWIAVDNQQFFQYNIRLQQELS